MAVTVHFIDIYHVFCGLELCDDIRKNLPWPADEVKSTYIPRSSRVAATRLKSNRLPHEQQASHQLLSYENYRIKSRLDAPVSIVILFYYLRRCRARMFVFQNTHFQKASKRCASHYLDSRVHLSLVISAHIIKPYFAQNLLSTCANDIFIAHRLVHFKKCARCFFYLLFKNACVPIIMLHACNASEQWRKNSRRCN